MTCPTGAVAATIWSQVLNLALKLAKEHFIVQKNVKLILEIIT